MIFCVESEFDVKKNGGVATRDLRIGKNNLGKNKFSSSFLFSLPFSYPFMGSGENTGLKR